MLKHHVAAALAPAALLLAVFVPLLLGVKAGLTAPESARSLSQAALPGDTAPVRDSAARSKGAPADKGDVRSKQAENENAEHAAALDRLFSPDYHACMDAAAGVTAAMQECMSAEAERLERHLAGERARLAPALSPERAQALNDALDAWENLRKSGSAAMYDPDGGTLAPVIASLWYLEQTARMARWLDGMQESLTP